jgi:Flp pilus assembly protein TadD
MGQRMKNAWKSPAAGAALIVLLTVAAYIPTLQGGFVFDDHDLIAENRMIQAGQNLPRFWFTAETRDYRPLTWSLWWLEWRLWDGRTTGYHVVNVLLHAGNSLLVWMILRRLKIPGAWLAAAVFAIHPVNVATVAWISEQKNTLSMLFCAAAIWFYLKFDGADRNDDSVVGLRGRAALDAQQRVPTIPMYALSLLAFLLALLSKTAVVMLPVVLLGCQWWLRGRLRRRDWLCSLPYFAAALVLALVTIVQHHQNLPGNFVGQASFAGRLATAGQVPWFYLGKAFLPLNLTVIYPKWEIDPTRWVSYVPGVILLGAFVVFWWKRASWGRPLLFGLGYFVVMLFPVLGFFDQGFYHFTLVADHWQYHSITGVIALVVAGGQKICSRIGRKSGCVDELMGVALLAVLGVASWERGHVYANDETLWRDNVTKNPHAWVLYYNLGVALGRSGKADEAIACYEQALQIKPDYADAQYNLGVALARLGRAREAIPHYGQALRITPYHAEAHNGLGLALASLGRFQEAFGHWEQALRLRPDYAEAHYNWGVTLARLNKLPEAIGHWEKAVQIKSNYPEAHNNLGGVFLRLGRVQEAIAEFDLALRSAPNMVESHYNLGVALEQTGRVQEAIEHYEQALRIKPDYADAQNALARLRTAR